MNQNVNPHDESLHVGIELSVDDTTRHYKYLNKNRTDAEKTVSFHKNDQGGTTVQLPATIRNGRDNPSLTLDEAAFELVNCPTNLSTEEFYKLNDENNEGLRTQYYKEIEDFVKAKIGCDVVMCFNHQVRNTTAQQGTSVGNSIPYGTTPHIDASPAQADLQALQIMELLKTQTEEEREDKEEMVGKNQNENKLAKIDLKRTKETHDTSKFCRYAYINLWRNISDDGPIENHHLAMLDQRSTVKPDDYVERDLIVNEDTKVTLMGLNARHNDRYQWYYFPSMMKDEALLFKQMDSNPDIDGRMAFHMSVADPEMSDVACRQRESIEVRMMCFWYDNEQSDGESREETAQNDEHTMQFNLQNNSMPSSDLLCRRGSNLKKESLKVDTAGVLRTARLIDLMKELLLRINVLQYGLRILGWLYKSFATKK